VVRPVWYGMPGAVWGVGGVNMDLRIDDGHGTSSFVLRAFLLLQQFAAVSSRGDVGWWRRPSLAVSRPSSNSLLVSGGVNTKVGLQRSAIFSASRATNLCVAKARTLSPCSAACLTRVSVAPGSIFWLNNLSRQTTQVKADLFHTT
jgi:hypothetical protein